MLLRYDIQDTESIGPRYCRYLGMRQDAGQVEEKGEELLQSRGMLVPSDTRYQSIIEVRNILVYSPTVAMVMMKGMLHEASRGTHSLRWIPAL